MEAPKETFDIAKHACREINPTELLQLLYMNPFIPMSWGVSKKHFIDKKAMRLKVQGHHHKGYVYITLSGSDLFDVYLTNLKDEIKIKIEGLYFDQLTDWIDEKVERIPEYTR